MNYWIFSAEASNFGSFSSGVCAIIGILLAICAIKSWRKERQLERKSEWAVQLLKDLYAFGHKFDYWHERLTWVYSKKDLSTEELLNHPFEIRNFLKKTMELNNYINELSTHGEFLDENIPALANKIDKYIKRKQLNLEKLDHVSFSDAEKKAARIDISQSPSDEVMQAIYGIKEKLKKIAFFEK